MKSQVVSWYNYEDMSTEYHIKVYDRELTRLKLDDFDKRVIFDPIKRSPDLFVALEVLFRRLEQQE